MIVARFGDWSHHLSVMAAAATMLLGGTLTAQEPRPLELRSWLTPRVATPLLSVSGDVTSCTLASCNQTASLFASTKVPFGVELTTGLRMSDLGTAQLGGRSALGSIYLGYDAGPVSIWSGATAGGRPRNAERLTPDPAPGLESGLALRWRQVGVALTAAGGRLTTPRGGSPPKPPPIIRFINDSLGFRADTIYPPSGDSTGTENDRWSSTEARITWRQDRWWITARAGRVASTRQATALWAGLQAGADLSHGVSLLLGAGKASRSLTYTGDRSATPHVSIGFGFNTAVLSPHGRTRGDSLEAPDVTSRPFVISDLGGGRYQIVLRVRAARSVEVACDCDGWTPMSMTRTGGLWLVDVHAAPGVHHVSIRVDGGGWIAPPGLTPIDDDFAGQAGLLVVP